MFQYRNVKQHEVKEIGIRAVKNFLKETVEKRAETFRVYGTEKCLSNNCYVPYFLQALVLHQSISEDIFQEIREICKHKWFMSQERGEEVSWDEAGLDWANKYATSFREEHPFKS